MAAFMKHVLPRLYKPTAPGVAEGLAIATRRQHNRDSRSANTEQTRCGSSIHIGGKDSWQC